MKFNMKKNIRTLGMVVGLGFMSASMSSCFSDADVRGISADLKGGLTEYVDSQSKVNASNQTTRDISSDLASSLNDYLASEAKKDSIASSTQEISTDLSINLKDYISSSSRKQSDGAVKSVNLDFSKKNKSASKTFSTNHSKKQTSQNDFVDYNLRPNRSSNKTIIVHDNCNRRVRYPSYVYSNNFYFRGYGSYGYNSFGMVSPVYFSAVRSRVNHSSFRQGPSFNAFISWNY